MVNGPCGLFLMWKFYERLKKSGFLRDEGRQIVVNRNGLGEMCFFMAIVCVMGRDVWLGRKKIG